MNEALIRNLIHLIPFLGLTVITFYLPGRLLIKSKAEKLRGLESLTLSYILGLIIFVGQAIIFGLLNLRFLTLPFILILVFLSLLKTKHTFRPFKKLVQNKLLTVLVLIGIIVLGAINFPSGLKYKQGIKFWSSQGHDGLWHVAVMQEVENNFPPQNPLVVNEKLTNYHYSGDIIMGEFFRIYSFFNENDLYFRFYPILFAFLIGISVYSFAQRRWDKKTAYWAVFFNYFAGSFAYWLLLIRGQFPLSGETMFWASQSNTILGNPPHTFGIILLTVIILLLQLWSEDKDNHWLIYLLLIGMGLTTFKVSAGGVLITGILAVGGYLVLFKKKFWFLIFSLILSGLNYLFLKVISPLAGSFLIFEPFWFPATMMIVRLGIDKWALKRQHYLHVKTFGSWCYLIWHYAKATALFIVGNTGMRLLGLIAIIKRIFKGVNIVDVFLGSGMLASLGILLLFVQKGIAYNLIQFMQIYFHFLGFYAAVAAVWLVSRPKKRVFKVLIAGLIILLTIPTAVGNLLDFYGRGHKANSIISNQELEALDWIKNKTDKEAVILTEPFDKDAHYGYNQATIPIHAWYSTTYVTVFSNRDVYLSGEEQLRITDYPVDKQLDELKEYFKSSHPQVSFVKDLNVDYIYINKDKEDEMDKFNNKHYKVEFENEQVAVLSIQ